MPLFADLAFYGVRYYQQLPHLAKISYHMTTSARQPDEAVLYWAQYDMVTSLRNLTQRCIGVTHQHK